MSGIKATGTAWIDLPPPETPAFTLDPLWVGITLACLLLLFYLLFRFLRQPRQQARRQLRRLRRNHTATGEQDYRRILQILRGYIGENSLERLPFSEATQQQAWIAFIQRLQHRAYAASPDNAVDLHQSIDEARIWLDSLGRRQHG